MAVCGPNAHETAALLEWVVREASHRALRVAAVAAEGGALAGLSSAADPALIRLLDDHDLVLVAGADHSALPKIWLAGADQALQPGLEGVLEVLPPSDDRPARLLTLLEDWLAVIWARRPRIGGVLVGGESRRMGQPKATVPFRGRALVEPVVHALADQVDEVVLLGNGPCPQSLAALPRVADATDCAGPLAGLLAALRFKPRATWVVAACDLPLVSEGAVAWLLEQRAPGRWAVVPSLAPGLVEPLLAVYEPQSRLLLERLARSGMAAPHRVAREAAVHCPQPPPELAAAWRNINTPEELRAAESETEKLHRGSEAAARGP